MVKVLEEARKLYNEGKWAEAIALLDENFVNGAEAEDRAESFRLYGWCYYYLGIKGPAEKKTEALRESWNMFNLVFATSSDTKKQLSAFNGLPLCLWILDKKKEAWEVSDKAVKEFSDEPSVWNTRSILCRWAKKFEESVRVCEKVYETALVQRDYRTAGHGKHNKADALKELGLIDLARDEYAAAVGLYRQFEETTGQSAEFHIEGVEKKLLALSV